MENISHLNDREIRARALSVLEENRSVFLQLNVDCDKVKALVPIFQSLCEDHPYHNWMHNVDVLCNANTLLKSCSLPLEPIEIFSVLLSTICHDIGHAGVSNAILESRGHPMAMRYNGVSPLEHNSASLMFHLLRDGAILEGTSVANAKGKNNVLKKLSPALLASFRRISTSLILCTDISNKDTNTLLSLKWDEAKAGFDPTSAEHRLVFLRLLIRSADVMVLSKPFDTFFDWMMRLRCELGLAAETAVGQEDLTAFKAGQKKFLSSYGERLFKDISFKPPAAAAAAAAAGAPPPPPGGVTLGNYDWLVQGLSANQKRLDGMTQTVFEHQVRGWLGKVGARGQGV